MKFKIMLYQTYENICKKHNVKPSQVIADKNIAEILTQDQSKHLKINEILLDNYLKVYYFNGAVAG